jgi:hypothetical protein
MVTYRTDSTTARIFRKVKAWKAFAGFLTFVIAVIGAVTGTISFFDQREVRVRLIAGTYEPDVRSSALRIGVVNDSSRGVSIVDGGVFFNGQLLGKINRVLPNTRLLSDAMHSTSDVISAARELPFAIAAGESIAGAVLWQLDDWIYSELKKEMSAISYADHIVYLFGPRGHLNTPTQKGMVARARKVAQTQLKLRIEVRFEPGGIQSIEVPVNRDAVPRRSSAWKVRMVLRRGLIKKIVARKHEPSGPVIATLRVWHADSTSLVRRTTRPVVTSDWYGFGSVSAVSVRFPLNGLRRGRYAWAIMVGARVVQTGIFVTPCLQARVGSGFVARLRWISGTVDAFECSPASVRTAERTAKSRP